MTPSDELAVLLERCRQDHRSWINGDASPYALPDDGSIMGAVGGFARGGVETADVQMMVARQWRSGRGEVELVNGRIEGDTAWIALIEHAVVEFVGDAEGVDHRWDLRVTEIFRRSSEGWHRVHRHADPLVARRPLREVAALCDRRD